MTEIVIRADAAGQTHWLAEDAAERNCWFSLGYGIDDRVRAGVTATTTDDWTPAIEVDGSHRDGAEVIDLTSKVSLKGWPAGTRLIVRRERPHPGAQLSLFDDINGRRHTAHITNQPGDPAVLELAHRQRGAVKDVIRDGWRVREHRGRVVTGVAPAGGGRLCRCGSNTTSGPVNTAVSTPGTSTD